MLIMSKMSASVAIGFILVLNILYGSVQDVILTSDSSDIFASELLCCFVEDYHLTLQLVFWLPVSQVVSFAGLVLDHHESRPSRSHRSMDFAAFVQKDKNSPPIGLLLG